ncbi:MAG TPA: hypothetical protein VIK33_04895 [Anaerolineae bacterium]
MRQLTLHRLVVAISFVSLFAMAVRTPADTDMWWHLRTGQYIAETRTLPMTDPFSHTQSGQPWINHSWLAQIGLYTAYAIGGFPALALLVALLVLIAFVAVWKQMEGGPFLRAFTLVLAAITSAVIWAPRPQMFTFALTAVLGYLIYLYKWRQVDRLWLLPPMFVLWANLHGGFAVGFILLACTIAGEVINHVLRHSGPEVLSWRRLGKLVAITALSYALLVLNPNTTAMYTYPLRTINIGVLRDFIQEWSSPDFHALFTQPFIWMLIATLAAVGWSSRRLDGGDFALVAGFAYSALLAGRNIAPFALVCAPVLARHAQAALERIRPGARRLSAGIVSINWIILIVVIALAAVKVVAALLPSVQDQAERETLPVDAMDWIEANHPTGPMFNSYNWGGYLIWRLWPAAPVYVDGRTDLYDDAFLRDYLKVAGAQPGFETILDRDRIGWVLFETDSALDVALSRDPAWRNMYRDARAVIFTRSVTP